MADREGLKAILGSSYCMNKKYVYSSASKLFNCNTHVKIKSTGLIPIIEHTVYTAAAGSKHRSPMGMISELRIARCFLRID